jgi:hypothetical protein
MKNNTRLLLGIAAVSFAFILSSCSNVTLSSWKNPKGEEKTVSHIVVWGMFEKLEYEQSFENIVTAYFNKKGMKAIPGLQILTPKKKYEKTELEQIFRDAGVDGALIVTYQGSEKTENYVPETVTVYPDFYYNYYNYYSWGYPVYAPGYSTVSSGGYWETSVTLHLRANLYGISKSDLLWTSEIAITDPKYVDQASNEVGKNIYSDWKSNGIVKK